MSTFSELELSIFGGRPVELYRFTCGESVWTYCAKGPITYGSEVYTKEAISRGSHAQDSDQARNDLQVTVSLANAVSQLFLVGTEQRVGLSIYKQQAGGTGTICFFRGSVTMATWNGNQCQLTCESIEARRKRAGRTPRHTKLCRVDLYGAQCGVDRSLYAVSGVVVAVDGIQVVVAEAGLQADGYFAGGILEVGDRYSTITKHTGTSITLWAPVRSMAVDNAVILYPGCDHSLGICRQRFVNAANYRGAPWLPSDNPFTGAMI